MHCSPSMFADPVFYRFAANDWKRLINFRQPHWFYSNPSLCAARSGLSWNSDNRSITSRRTVCADRSNSIKRSYTSSVQHPTLRQPLAVLGISSKEISPGERWRSPSRRQKTMIQIRGRPATWLDRFVRRHTSSIIVSRLRHLHSVFRRVHVREVHLTK
jgi:hypothetical protein